MAMRIPRLRIKILLESNPPKSRILVQRLAAVRVGVGRADHRERPRGSHIILSSIILYNIIVLYGIILYMLLYSTLYYYTYSILFT